MTPVRVYIAGPLTTGNQSANVRRACEMFSRLRSMGYHPVCPHWSVLQDMTSPGDMDYEAWMRYCFEEVDTCHALLRLPGHSPGGDREVARARAIGIPVFEDVSVLSRATPPGRGHAA